MEPHKGLIPASIWKWVSCDQNSWTLPCHYFTKALQYHGTVSPKQLNWESETGVNVSHCVAIVLASLIDVVKYRWYGTLDVVKYCWYNKFDIVKSGERWRWHMTRGYRHRWYHWYCLILSNLISGLTMVSDGDGPLQEGSGDHSKEEEGKEDEEEGLM